MDKMKAAFFDRDGTLIEDVNYLSNINQIKLLPGIVQFCLDLQKQGFKLFVVTNQSGIARGFFDEDFVKFSHLHLKELFASKNVFFQEFFYCPHHPSEAVKDIYLKSCECRKPKPGMLLRAAEIFNIDLSKSLMFGDRLLDIQAGHSAGCKSFYIKDVLNLKRDEYGKRGDFKSNTSF